MKEKRLSDREVTKSLFIKRVKKSKKPLIKADPERRKIKERKRAVEDSEAELEIKEFTK